MTISNIFKTIIIISTLHLSAAAQPRNYSVQMFTDKTQCILKIKFNSKGKQPTQIPDYTTFSKDTLDGFKMLPTQLTSLETDTLIIQSSHISDGPLSLFENEGLQVSYTNTDPKITIKRNLKSITKKDIQLFKLPNSICKAELRYFIIKIDRKLWAQGNIYSNGP